MKKGRISENGRGQAALEYLMTYGWAILVILIVGIALWQMGVFNPPATQPGCSGFSQLMPLDAQYISSTKTLNVILANEAGTKLKIIKANVTVGSDSDENDYSGSPIDIRPGLSRKEIFTFSTGKASGEYFRAAITVEYNNTMSKIVHRSSGFCWGTVE